MALVAAAVIVPVSLTDSADGAPCRHIPAAVLALADDPAAATKPLDPMAGTSRLSRGEPRHRSAMTRTAATVPVPSAA
ncbi:hypothetical protein [Streptomyces sp. NPDC050264]|uniref:hypothetical protein n=1 Tax=Streptomyces sp. NPDC050264 TaxID=3155038 RepID=UPI00343716AD